jgi:hypothetical protein
MAHPVLSKAMVIMTTPSAGGPQEMVCLPLPLLPGWQMTINANKVSSAARVASIRTPSAASSTGSSRLRMASIRRRAS